ncbi:hypothetical protein [Rhodococcoides fascians]|uniref:hypothetical protein n=1 Tax=Rhodococcoides fascians TaxID=1828 RepID=UPI000566454B|nr:hypothetical protein [Rhodococcus fascians]
MSTDISTAVFPGRSEYDGGLFKVKVFTPSNRDAKPGWPDTRDGDCQIDVAWKNDYGDFGWDEYDNWSPAELRKAARAMLAAADRIDELRTPASEPLS